MEGCSQPLGSCQGKDPAPSCFSIQEGSLPGNPGQAEGSSQPTPPHIHAGRAPRWENSLYPSSLERALTHHQPPSAYCGAPGPT